MTVKDKIIDLRIRSGLTQEQFAEKANIDLEQLKAVENGERLPDEDMRVAISQAFELSAYELTPDIDEQDEYDRQSEAENTVDTQLPYNPFFREGSEGNVGTASQPVVANYKSVLRTNGILMSVVPAVIGTVAMFFIALIAAAIFKDRLDLSSNTGIAASILVVFITFLTLIISRIFYFKAFSKLGVIDRLKDKFWLFFASKISLVGLLTYSINKLIDKNLQINNADYYSDAVKRIISSTNNILVFVLGIAIIISLLHLFYGFINDSQKDNIKTYIVAYSLVIGLTVVAFIVTSVLGRSTDILTIVSLVLRALMTIMLLYLIKHNDKLNSKVFTVIIPIVFFVLNFIYETAYPLTI